MVRGQLRNFVNIGLKSAVEFAMFVRLALVCACLAGTASAAAAQELAPDEARAFVVGKLFAYTCFDGTVGLGRIFPDGSVVGTIRGRGQTETRFAALPANTIRVNGNAMCASLPGLPIQPCFKVQKLDRRSFRGSLSGLSFAYCDFYQHNPRSQLTSRSSVPPPPQMPVATLRPAED